MVYLRKVKCDFSYNSGSTVAYVNQTVGNYDSNQGGHYCRLLALQKFNYDDDDDNYDAD